MKTIFSFIAAILVADSASAAGFTDAEVLFYGEVRQVGGAQTTLLQSGTLQITFVNRNDPSNTVTRTTSLRPTGAGDIKPYSYSLGVPTKFLPDADEKSDFLAISAQEVDFEIRDITIDGRPATLPDGSKEFYPLSFASRSSQYRLDLIVGGDSTDTDGDGLADWWEELYGLDPDLADSGTDFDNDGWSNLEEFRRGSNPAVSNRNPMMASAEILIPESGEAGLYPVILDSDTPDEEIQVTLMAASNIGMEIKVDGEPMAGGAPQSFPLSDLHSGRVTIAHTDRSLGTFALAVEWNDGGEEDYSGELLVRVVSPSFADGSDAALWLDGHDLPASGSAIGSWGDRSGNARHASQPLVGYQPKVAGQSADFSGGRLAHLFFQDSAMPAGDVTVLAAYTASAVSGAPQTLLSTNRGYLQFAATTQPVSYPGAPTWQLDGAAIHGYENATGALTTSIFRRGESQLQNILGLSHDGKATTATEIEPVLPTLGARRSAIPEPEVSPLDQAFAGRLHELLVFPSALPEQKLRGVHDYLQSKWDGAVIWDFSTSLQDITLNAGSGSQRRIIRGGFGNDRLSGGDGDDTLSGGGGDDILTGGGGKNRFVFGGVDTGRDTITDFDSQHDIIDLSAPFRGMTGDARAFISVRLEANYSTPTPTLDSVLIVTHPDAGSREIVLQNLVVGSTQLIRLIGEGRIRMGGLSIPNTVQLALGESADQSFTLTVTRSGAGVAAALDVPIGFFQDALGGLFVVEGATSSEGKRAVVSFARGETSKTLTVRPIPDLESTGPSDVEIAVLPHYRYAVAGAGVSQTIGDNPLVWLEVIEPDATANPLQPARVRLHRSGDTAAGLTVDLDLTGTAENGVHVDPVPASLTFAAGQGTRELQISARTAGLSDGPKVALIRLASRDHYLSGNPHEALIYVGNTASETDNAGFERWLLTSTGGAISSYADLRRVAPGKVDDYLKAYAFGLGSVDELGRHGLGFRIVDGRPELSVPGRLNAADLRWTMQTSAGLAGWDDDSAAFTKVTDASGLKLVGPLLDPADDGRFYRLDMNLDPGQLAGGTIAAMTGSDRYGMSGNGDWNADAATGDLVSSGGGAGETNRIVANITGPATLDFEMEILDGDGSDSLVFYLDGVRQAATGGATAGFQQTLADGESRVLMWEFTRGSGKAVIRNLAP